MRSTRGLTLTLFPLALALVATSARAEDTQPPEITHSPITALAKGQPVKVTAKITDQSKFFPQVFYKWDGAAAYEKPIDMKTMKGKKNKNMFEATVPAKGTATFEYYIEAYDEFGNGPARSGTPEAPHKIEAPAAVAAADPPAEEKTADAPPETPKTEEKVAEAPPEPPAETKATKKKMAATEPAPEMEPSGSPSASGGQRTRLGTWVVGGTGVGMLVGGALTGLAFKKADDAYSARVKDSTNNPATLQQQYDATKSVGTMSTVLLVSGVALVGGGVALYFLENPDKGSGKRAEGEPAKDGRLQFAAAPVQGGAAAVVAGRF